MTAALYLSHFGLTSPPFRLTPETQWFYPGARRQEILEALLYLVDQGEGLIKVTGEVGTGKTLLCRMLLEQLPKHIDSVYLLNPLRSPQEIFASIASDLGVLMPEGAHVDPLRHLEQALIDRHANGRHVVVLVDEAHSVPDNTLEALRLLSNLETGQQKLLQIVMFGQPELDDKLAQSHLRQLRERITHQFQLPLLRPQEVAEYLGFRLRVAGRTAPNPFSEGAIRRLTRQADGLVRRVHLLADKALLAAFASGSASIEAHHIQQAVLECDFSRGQAKASTLGADWRRVPWRLLLLIILATLVGLGLGVWWRVEPLKPTRSIVPSAPIAEKKEEIPRQTSSGELRGALLEAKRGLGHDPKSWVIWLYSLRVGASAQLAEKEWMRARALLPSEQVWLYPAHGQAGWSWILLSGGYSSRVAAEHAQHDFPPSLRTLVPKLSQSGALSTLNYDVCLADTACSGAYTP